MGTYIEETSLPSSEKPENQVLLAKQLQSDKRKDGSHPRAFLSAAKVEKIPTMTENTSLFSTSNLR